MKAFQSSRTLLDFLGEPCCLFVPRHCPTMPLRTHAKKTLLHIQQQTIVHLSVPSRQITPSNLTLLITLGSQMRKPVNSLPEDHENGASPTSTQKAHFSSSAPRRKRRGQACLVLGRPTRPVFFLKHILCSLFFFFQKKSKCCNITIPPKSAWSPTNHGNSTPTKSGFKNAVSPSGKKRDGQLLPNKLTANFG